MTIRNRVLATCVALCTSVAVLAPAHANIVAKPVSVSAPGALLNLEAIGTHETGEFEKSAAEIVAYHAASKRLLVVNALSGKITVLDVSKPEQPTELHTVSAGAGTTVNSVAVRPDGLAVATVEPADKTAAGSVIFFDAAGNGDVFGSVPVGSLPDMVTITEDGAFALVANEGEPAEDYSVDPEGSVSVISLPKKVAAGTEVRTATFTAFEGKLPQGVRVFGPEGTDAQNLEPEYISTLDGKAYVALQENNAVAVVDIATATVTDIYPLGTIDHSVVPFDPSDKDGATKLRTAPVKSFRLPDALAAYTAAGKGYFVTANEGDTRDWKGFSEEERVKKLKLSPDFAGLNADQIKQLQSDEQLGRLKVTTTAGQNSDGTYDELYGFGGRGFSIFDTNGNLVFDSGSEFEKILSELPEQPFNPDHTSNDADDRSDDKGAEPEGLTLGTIGSHTFAFIGLERTSGIMVYDITDPQAPAFVTYLNNRDFAAAPDSGTAGDLGPEGLTFIPAEQSPNGKPLLAVGNEVSGTTTIYQVNADPSLTTPVKEPGGTSSSMTSSGSSTLGSSIGVIGGIAAILAAIAGIAPHIPGLQAQIHQLLAMLNIRR
ncbi:choice-of-anchor I family protein [Corynebacterium epidermidicanis]|uniref:Choice-of-anchor I domain-containing protein n=1 Tax=Corynebacterium epidermidicanis TaxID=1050174 RepID=A0A0G3GX96_9CORY|nr:choice-of-anchor I family protein [Corynebacterium epidermidicanis]AKK03497.1 hypothetical protein CEPID_08235 [Corynebacterium epidermidicanis]